LRADARARATTEAPPEAWLSVEGIDREGTEVLRTQLFYDAEIKPLGSGSGLRANYDPRERIWYQRAVATDGLISSGFYRFALTGETGVTIARRTANALGVVGADLTLREIYSAIDALRITPSTEIGVYSRQGGMLVSQAEATTLGRSALTDRDHTAVKKLYDAFEAGTAPGKLDFYIEGRHWLASLSELPAGTGVGLFLGIAVPEDELLAGIIEIRNKSILVSLVLLAVAIAVAWWVAGRISRSLRELAAEARSVRQLRFDRPVRVRSRISEVDDLANAMNVMKSGIQHFIDISKALSAERHFERLLEAILAEARAVCRADGGSLFLYDEERGAVELCLAMNEQSGLRYGIGSGPSAPGSRPSLRVGEASSSPRPIEVHTVETGETTAIGEVDRATGFDFAGVRARHERKGYQVRSSLHLALRNRQGGVVGILELVNARDDAAGQLVPFSPEALSYVQGVASQAAIAIENRRLLEAQKQLLDSFIQLIAAAIDAKSPYTSGHCQRVPELARLLADAAHESEAEPFRQFRLSTEDRYELHIASWLHDCGKVTTPEYVVDKATKLECIYDRIHEIRMRFEVLWRDAEIDFYRALGEPGADRERLARELDDRHARILDDFAFVAECNVGGESMSDERVARLREIASQRWTRHLDDRLGLSIEELARKQRTEAAALPVEEQLIADKPEHLVERIDGGEPFGDNPHGFNLAVPSCAFNFGELYNLSVRYGTLTEEERFKINEHIVQTIVLLGKLPFPKELRRVPGWAGNHHEKLDGTGYPRGLKADGLTIPERVMAIADIFEALTARDRPYKKAKTLSESIRIMSVMRDKGHICPDLFALFLSSGVYRKYAERFLAAEQIDSVDTERYLS